MRRIGERQGPWSPEKVAWVEAPRSSMSSREDVLDNIRNEKGEFRVHEWFSIQEKGIIGAT